MIDLSILKLIDKSFPNLLLSFSTIFSFCCSLKFSAEVIVVKPVPLIEEADPELPAPVLEFPPPPPPLVIV